MPGINGCNLNSLKLRDDCVGEMAKLWNKAVMTCLRHYVSIRVGGLKKIIKDFTGWPSCEQRFVLKTYRTQSRLVKQYIVSFCEKNVCSEKDRKKSDKKVRTCVNILCSLHYFFNDGEVRKCQLTDAFVLTVTE